MGSPAPDPTARCGRSAVGPARASQLSDWPAEAWRRDPWMGPPPLLPMAARACPLRVAPPALARGPWMGPPPLHPMTARASPPQQAAPPARAETCPCPPAAGARRAHPTAAGAR
eukprot:5479854-Pyramimonas_sp.AAC.1